MRNDAISLKTAFIILKSQRTELGIREQALDKKEKLLTGDISRLNKENERLRKENSDLNLKIKRLNIDLKIGQNNDKELQSLREMIFKLDQTKIPYIDALTLEDMVGALTLKKIVFISGQISLVNKLK